MHNEQQTGTVRRAWALLVTLVIATGAAACTPAPPTPNVVGKPEAEARKTLEALGADVTVTKARQGKPPGTVISQTPAPEAALPETVQLVVEEGGGTGAQREVPNVVAKTEAEADATLTAAGLAVGAKTRRPGGGAPGTVLDQNPKPAGQVAAGTAVDLVLVDGGIVAVPGVVGQPEAAALAALTQAGLGIGQVTRRLEGAGQVGTIVEQNPKAGLQVARDQPVDLVVKDDGVRVPDVVGRPLESVAVSLLSSGLRYRMESRRLPNQAPGVILAVTPGANTLVPRDSEVRMVVSRKGLVFEGALKDVVQGFETRRLELRKQRHIQR